MSNIKVFSRIKNWWVNVSGDAEGRVEVAGHLWNPVTHQWEHEEKADEVSPRRLSEDLLAEAMALNETTRELLDVTQLYAKEKTFMRKEFVIYSDYDPANDAAYVFDSFGRTDIDAGWIDTGGYDIAQFSVMVTTLASTSILLLIQGDLAGQLTDYYTKTYSAVTTRAELITVTLPPKKLRVGLMVTVNGTDAVTITCECKRM